MKELSKIIRSASVFTILFFCSLTIFSQPAVLQGYFVDLETTWNSSNLVDRGVVKATTIQASFTNLNAKFLFNNVNGNFDPKWSGSNENYYRNVDEYHDGAAYYCAGLNCSTWSRDLETSITSGNYYTFIINGLDASSTSNRSISILETSFMPVSISNVSQNPSVDVNKYQSVAITVTLSSLPNAQEKTFVRYTTDSWVSSNFIEITLFDSNLKGTAKIPVQAVGTKVEYYVLTTKLSIPDASTIDYFTLNISNNNLLNYSYTVVDAVVNQDTCTFQFSLGLDLHLCNGENVVLKPDISENNYESIEWSTGLKIDSIIVSSDGDFFATITNVNGCIYTDSINVLVGAIPFVDIGAGGILCDGETKTLVVSGTFVSYLWSDNSTNDSLLISNGGTYSVTVTNSDGCVGFDVVNYTENVTPIADFSYSVENLTLTLTNLSTNQTSSIWDFGNGSTDNSNLSTVSETFSEKGTYSISLNVSNSCGSDQKLQNIVVTNVDFIENENNQIYPNPVYDILNLDMKFKNNTDVLIIIKDIQGKEVFYGKYSDTIDLSKLNQGEYILEIISNNEKFSKQIFKK